MPMLEIFRSETFDRWLRELRIDYGPGYRVYFIRRGPRVILLLCGGNKRTQGVDVKRAIEIAARWSD